MTSMAKQARRKLRFETLDEIAAEADRWMDGEYDTVGNWTRGQILWHLAATINCSFDGFGFGAPWFARLLAPLVKRWFLTKPMPAGFKLPKTDPAAGRGHFHRTGFGGAQVGDCQISERNPRPATSGIRPALAR